MYIVSFWPVNAYNFSVSSETFFFSSELKCIEEKTEPYRIVSLYFAIFKNVAHSLGHGATPSNWYRQHGNGMRQLKQRRDSNANLISVYFAVRID